VPSVIVDPGRAFGTGAHETTRLCLQFVIELERGSLLDLGCGSGVIAIAAAKLGFAPVSAMDSDVAAVDATRRNAESNGVAVDMQHADALNTELPEAHVTVANIEAQVVRELAARVRSPFFVTSGYYRSEVVAPVGFSHIERREEHRWAADLFHRERKRGRRRL
jgi:ribosomal protein L11 methyltransferase